MRQSWFFPSNNQGFVRNNLHILLRGSLGENHCRSCKSFVSSISEFVKKRWQLQPEQKLFITFRDPDHDECIFQGSNFQDSLTCTLTNKIWFTVHLPWSDRFKLRPWKLSEPWK
ncbi:unnamed protein product [Polarella glacialis]|uniref:Uncharacterized protein n=1 Tax=Polarella glacialis TaxID=89957 RepID=A0A813EKJ8_POLGL|nr:unnamed protein product [Polarella glacialis]